MVFLQRPLAMLKTEPVFTTPTEAFWTYMKVAMITGVFIAMPIILWNVWAFVAPGLHKHERNTRPPSSSWARCSSSGAGPSRCFVVIPFAVQFLLNFGRSRAPADDLHLHLRRLHHSSSRSPSGWCSSCRW